MIYKKCSGYTESPVLTELSYTLCDPIYSAGSSLSSTLNRSSVLASVGIYFCTICLTNVLSLSRPPALSYCGYISTIAASSIVKPSYISPAISTDARVDICVLIRGASVPISVRVSATIPLIASIASVSRLG